MPHTFLITSDLYGYKILGLVDRDVYSTTIWCLLISHHFREPPTMRLLGGQRLTKLCMKPFVKKISGFHIQNKLGTPHTMTFWADKWGF
jgi:hypothetical protein